MTGNLAAGTFTGAAARVRRFFLGFFSFRGFGLFSFFSFCGLDGHVVDELDVVGLEHFKEEASGTELFGVVVVVDAVEGTKDAAHLGIRDFFFAEGGVLDVTRLVAGPREAEFGGDVFGIEVGAGVIALFPELAGGEERRELDRLRHDVSFERRGCFFICLKVYTIFQRLSRREVMTISFWIKFGAVAIGAVACFLGGYQVAAALYGRDIAQLREEYAVRAKLLEENYRGKEAVARQSLIAAWEERDAAHREADRRVGELDALARSLRDENAALRSELPGTAGDPCAPCGRSLIECSRLLDEGSELLVEGARVRLKDAGDIDAIRRIVK